MISLKNSKNMKTWKTTTLTNYCRKTIDFEFPKEFIKI